MRCAIFQAQKSYGTKIKEDHIKQVIPVYLHVYIFHFSVWHTYIIDVGPIQSTLGQLTPFLEFESLTLGMVTYDLRAYSQYDRFCN